MIGKTILNYRITALLGRGGMGSVYLAEHTLIANERVAIKVINANMANDFTRKLLHDEAERLASLNHPNIVAFKNYHIDKCGNIYLVMEYAEGKSLEEYINSINGLIVEERICPIFEPILEAVGYAHKKGILHCDIKPANIIITPEGSPKVLDFGIARIIKQQGEHNETDNIVMGTPSYMSPEQVKGEHLDARSDIYSLGVLLHQMLTGNAPYDTTTLTEQEINAKVVEEPLPRMRTYYKYISDKLQRIVDKATSKDPVERYQSCEEFRRDLHRAVYPWRPSKWMKAVAAVFIALIVGSGIYIWDYNRVKTYYYKDYVERWGIPEGIGELSRSEHRHAARSYRFIYHKRKLLRVSHVNSLDNLIADGESERKDRPADQTFSYRADGKVDHVLVKDENSKVLYVKSYNAKLNTMAFQYNDEHGTERTISNSTVGYDDIVSENVNNKGRISRWWLDYDDNGFVTRLRYAGWDNSPAGDNDGIYGQIFVRDEKGRPLEIHYIGEDGEPQSTNWGLGIKKFQYDNEDNWVKATYLTIDGKPAYDDYDGIAIYEMEYDDYGNLIYALHKDGDGIPMYPAKHNVAGFANTYDDNGFNISVTAIDDERTPMYVKGMGYSIARYEYDGYGYCNKVTYYDTQGNPVETKLGCSTQTYINDRRGNQLEQWNFDTDGNLCDDVTGASGYKAEYDTTGNMTRIVYYDTERQPCQIYDGAFGQVYEYDERGLCTSETNLGGDLSPAPDNDGIAITRYVYDKHGNRTRVALYDTDGKTLKSCNDGYARLDMVYDESGNMLELSFFDADGKPMIEAGCAKVTFTYDEHNHLSKYRYLDTDGDLVSVDGVAGYDYVKDKRGNTLEERPVGTDGKLAQNKLIMKRKYDKVGNCVEQAVFDADGADENYNGIHRWTYVFDSRNQLLEQRFYDKHGKLTEAKEWDYAIQANEYNDKGERTKCSYFGSDSRPCKSSDGWSSATYEYDKFGNIVRQCFFDTSGRPTSPDDIVPVAIAEYDKWGNMTYLASQDAKGNFITDTETGCAIQRKTYDERSNILSTSCFDSQNKPTLCSEGYHKIMYTYDKKGHQTGTSYFGTDGKAMLINNVHKITYEVENDGNITQESCYGKNGQPVNCDAGWHKVVYTYNEDRTLRTTAKYYDKNGSLTSTFKWNGSSWEAVYSWKDLARQLKSELPIYLGSDYYDLTLKSLSITGSNTCTLTFTVPHTTWQLGDEAVSFLHSAVDELTKGVEEALEHKAYVTGILYDKNNTKIYSIRY